MFHKFSVFENFNFFSLILRANAEPFEAEIQCNLPFILSPLFISINIENDLDKSSHIQNKFSNNSH